MAWRTEEFGDSHEGIVGAVLADGGEPAPVYFDIGGGGAGRETRELWAYDGRLGRPEAAAFRAACACGWRGESHPLDGQRIPEDPLDDLDTSAAFDDWREHIRAVERQTVPLPEEVTDLVRRLDERLTVLADQAPVAALKSVAALERLSRRIGQEAAYAARADELAPEAIGRALGITPTAAEARLSHYLLPG
ncbi:hypothetical protein [Streptomyces sp. SLBN-31]|uniref:hypothetical protein n=1 Tax=Streptomyces sp. SLBN-31 TaxID=2768444 RepID=UPI00115415FD|nr:hypothetical protein [Streptomyces sp. SLBN-31]